MSSAAEEIARGSDAAGIHSVLGERAELRVRAALWLALSGGGDCDAVPRTECRQAAGSSTTGIARMPCSHRVPNMDQSSAGNMGDPVYQERRMRQINAAQHKAMVSDTDSC